jgi:Fe-S cluster biosynthesis and repair protein YggX
LDSPSALQSGSTFSTRLGGNVELRVSAQPEWDHIQTVLTTTTTTAILSRRKQTSLEQQMQQLLFAATRLARGHLRLHCGRVSRKKGNFKNQFYLGLFFCSHNLNNVIEVWYGMRVDIFFVINVVIQFLGFTAIDQISV